MGYCIIYKYKLVSIGISSISSKVLRCISIIIIRFESTNSIIIYKKYIDK